MARTVASTTQGEAWVDLKRPVGDARSIAFIGHGAGGGVEAPDILVVTRALLAHGVVVARVTQPYRVAGKRAPVPAPRLDSAWLEVVSAVRRRRGLSALPLVFSGRSSGARVACRTSAGLADAVVALAFPLHPPGRPEKTRLDELDGVTVPTLVVQGDRDAFGQPPPRLSGGAPRAVLVIEGADHSLKRDAATIASGVIEFLQALELAT
ncbi:hypothetical protein SAMN05892883_2536 [Jatrophihabitans sp. GAS493]|uniref:alpha/beta hydrolase family protein n=1 Tax=Jatrophihabitans sp. GAS493 TaxID=1907575 RepID=UPI000BC08B53|nr:alpha/beta family hydrolase [Jatrophihabitans sp. GAS493]SOD73246.1 hypothetical protein SAMN05892883_2536 [Jatrophihabitans sp. GAS493]